MNNHIARLMNFNVIISFVVFLSLTSGTVIAETIPNVNGVWKDKQDGLVLSVMPCLTNKKTVCATVIGEILQSGEDSQIGQVIVRDITAGKSASTKSNLWHGTLNIVGAPESKVVLKLKSENTMEATICTGWLCETTKYIRQ